MAKIARWFSRQEMRVIIKFISKKRTLQSVLYTLLGLVVLGYLLSKAISGGNDINVYVHAARQLTKGSNIYILNPFNNYLYSPLFALMLVPLVLVPAAVARVVWLLLNIAIIIRLWVIQKKLITGTLALSKSNQIYWNISIALLSFGFLNHNFNLGQVTILLLWLTVEGLLQIRQRKLWKGTALLALGINIKIIPLLLLVHLFFKIEIRAIVYTILLVTVSLLLPAFFIGLKFNNKLLYTWKNIINPAGEKYVFENNDGCHSLNALLPAFFYDFEEPSTIEKQYPDWNYRRKIASVPEPVLVLILQASRVLLLLIIPVIAYYRLKERQPEYAYLYFFWEMAYLLLITLLLFPHQMKYSMLYFVPVGAYIIFYYLFVIQEKLKINSTEKMTGVLAGLFMLILAIMGRDIIGNHLVNFLDYYHFMGINNLLFLIILAVCNPHRLVQLHITANHSFSDTSFDSNSTSS